mmetsp:Transcript_43652/g.139046  ORF Transcript_43652/g.139046 Transcript_43652/m.139046 type:complete len:237 (-) Transcript_43652:24-734(-)
MLERRHRLLCGARLQRRHRWTRASSAGKPRQRALVGRRRRRGRPRGRGRLPPWGRGLLHPCLAPPPAVDELLQAVLEGGLLRHGRGWRARKVDLLLQLLVVGLGRPRRAGRRRLPGPGRPAPGGQGTQHELHAPHGLGLAALGARAGPSAHGRVGPGPRGDGRPRRVPGGRGNPGGRRGAQLRLRGGRRRDTGNALVGAQRPALRSRRQIRRPIDGRHLSSHPARPETAPPRCRLS